MRLRGSAVPVLLRAGRTAAVEYGGFFIAGDPGSVPGAEVNLSPLLFSADGGVIAAETRCTWEMPASPP
ncbi:MAG: hypothetical protein GX600_01080 [Dehalococcoidia bacterium]|nr:hypothetical protein [Dehalococcoidia bacterium]